MATATGYYNPLLTGVLGGYQPGALTQQAQGYQMGPLSQLAYQMAGSPQRGPFADAGTPPAVPGVTAGATGPATGMGGNVLSALSTLNKGRNALNAVNGLLGGSLASYGSGAAADAAVTAALGSVGAQTGATAAGIEAANDAALTGGGVFGTTGSGATGAAASTPAATGSSSALGSIGAYAGPIAIAAAPYLLGRFMSGHDNSSSGYYGIGDINDMANAVKQATAQYGPLSAQSTNPAQAAIWNEVGSNPTDPKVQSFLQAVDDLNQMQSGVGGVLGTQSDYVQGLLNSMGYQSLVQQENAPGVLKPGMPGFVGGSGASSRGTARK